MSSTPKREMIADVLADLRDGQRRLGQHEQHAIGLDRPRDVDGLAVTVGQVDHGVSPGHALTLRAPCCSTHRAKVRKVAHAEATISSVRAPARARPSSQARKRRHLAEVPSASPTKNEAPLPLATPEPLAQRRGDDLPAEAGALEHVQAARQVLGARQPRQVGASRQVGNLPPRQAQRQEIALDQLGAGPQRKAERGARRRHARQAGFNGSVETEEEFEHPPIAVERELGFEQPQLDLETPMQVGRFALQLLAERRSALAAPIGGGQGSQIGHQRRRNVSRASLADQTGIR